MIVKVKVMNGYAIARDAFKGVMGDKLYVELPSVYECIDNDGTRFLVNGLKRNSLNGRIRLVTNRGLVEINRIATNHVINFSIGIHRDWVELQVRAEKESVLKDIKEFDVQGMLRDLSSLGIPYEGVNNKLFQDFNRLKCITLDSLGDCIQYRNCLQKIQCLIYDARGIISANYSAEGSVTTLSSELKRRVYKVLGYQSDDNDLIGLSDLYAYSFNDGCLNIWDIPLMKELKSIIAKAIVYDKEFEFVVRYTNERTVELAYWFVSTVKGKVLPVCLSDKFQDNFYGLRFSLR